MIRYVRNILILVLIVCASSVYAQEKMEQQHESKEAHEMKSASFKELDAFHELLHPLVHEAYPAKDFAAIKKGIPGLIKSAAALKTAALPKELSAKKTVFNKTAKKLLQQLNQLDKKKETWKDKEYGEKFMAMHDTFEKMIDMTR